MDNNKSVEKTFSWAFEETNGNCPEIRCFRDSPYPQKSAYSVSLVFLFLKTETTGCGRPQSLPAIAVFWK